VSLRPSLGRVSHWAAVPLALVLTASLFVSTADAAPAPGSAGTDTSLPATESQVTVSGRGRFANLRITVNQTENLLSQAVSITWTGGSATGGPQIGTNFLQIMQCWGDPDETIPDNPGPPPEQCVQGARTGAPAGTFSTKPYPNGFSTTRLISRSDWPDFDPDVGRIDGRGTAWREFRAVNGTVVDFQANTAYDSSVRGSSFWLNPFFSIFNTNEIAGARTGLNGRGAALMQLNTGVQSSGLGCGQRIQPVPGGQLKVPQCWIVVVPRGEAADENVGSPNGDGLGVYTSPVAPEPWKNRIAIPIEFSPVESPCKLGVGERRIAGSELAFAALTSWQPALCASGSLPPFSFAPQPDPNARQQIVNAPTGAPGMVVVSRPVSPDDVDPANPIVYAPLSSSGLVIGFTIERIPSPSNQGSSAEEEAALAGVRVAELNLTPRLVAKLLTQSYRAAIAINGSVPPSPEYDWLTANPQHLAADPDFRQFNPEFDLLGVADPKMMSGLQLPLGNSDAATQVWEWILADPEARAWLGGAPDQWGMVVNPRYSTDAAVNPSGSSFADPVPISFPKTDPYCYQKETLTRSGKPVVPPALCSSDWLPYALSLAKAAEVTQSGIDGTKLEPNDDALAPSEVWKRTTPPSVGERGILSITDTPSAARYGIQTARLSRAGANGSDRAFFAPDANGLALGVAAMVPSAVPGVLQADPLAVAPGAYPLTALTYAAIAPLALDTQARSDYAAFLEYAADPGQVPGLERGQLPAGYAGLPSDLRAQTALAAVTVRELVAASPIPVATTPTAPASPAAPAATGSSPTSDDPGGAATNSTSSQSGTTSRSSGSSSSPSNGGVSTAAVDATAVGEAPGVVEAPAAEAPTLDALAEPALETESSRSPLITPILALGRSRYAIPAIAIVALLSLLGALEISKRPRRRLAAETAELEAAEQVGVLVDA
jgi:hypothetical protein